MSVRSAVRLLTFLVLVVLRLPTLLAIAVLVLQLLTLEESASQ